MESKPLAQSLSFWGLIMSAFPGIQEAMPELISLIPVNIAPWVTVAGVALGIYGIKRRDSKIKGVVTKKL